MSNYTWCVFVFWEGSKEHGKIGKPTLAQIDPGKMDKVLWNGGPSYMDIHSNMQLTVLAWYDDIPVKNQSQAYQRFYLQYVPCKPEVVSEENARSSG